MRSFLRNLALAAGALSLSVALIGCEASTPAPAGGEPKTTPPAGTPDSPKDAMEGPAPKGGPAMEGPAPKGGPAMEGPAPKTEPEAPKADTAPPVEKPKEEGPK